MQPWIQLHEHTGIGVVPLCSSGVHYSNQTGGCFCLHPEVQGVYVALGEGSSRVEVRLNEHFETEWAGRCYNRTGDLVDQLLAAAPGTNRFRVERQRRGDSHKAWIYVRLLGPDDTERSLLDTISGFPAGTLGVLTWENIDQHRFRSQTPSGTTPTLDLFCSTRS